MAQNEVTTYLKGDDKDLKRALKGSQKNVSDYAKLVKGALAGIAGAFAIKKAIDFGTAFVSARKEQVVAEARLAGVLKATGEAAGFSLKQMKALASEAQKLTGFGDEVVLGWQSVLATFRNVRGDHFREATLLAADMAVTLGTDGKSAALQLGKALNDPVLGVTALSRAGIQFTEQQKDQIKAMAEAGDMMGAQRVILDELQHQMGGVAATVLEQTGGWDALKGRVGDLYESFGELLIPALDAAQPIFDTILTYVERLTGALVESSEGNKAYAASWSDWIAEGIEYGLSLFVDAYTGMEFIITNWSKIIDREVNANILAMVSFWEEVKYLFTEVGPAYLSWFAENWFNIWKDVQSMQLTVLQNMGTNIGNFFSWVVSKLTGGSEEFKWVGLLEGFESTMTELPKIAERQLSDTEKGLQSYISTIDNDMAKSFSEISQKNRKFFEGTIKNPEENKIDLTPNLDSKQIAKEVEEVTAEVTKELEQVKGSADSSRDGLISDLKKREAQLQQERDESRVGETTDLLSLNTEISSASAERAEKAIEMATMAELDMIARQIEVQEEAKKKEEEMAEELKKQTKQAAEQVGALKALPSEIGKHVNPGFV